MLTAKLCSMQAELAEFALVVQTPIWDEAVMLHICVVS